MLRPLRLAPRLVAGLPRRMPLCTAADPKAPPEPPPAGDRADGTGHEEAELRWRVLEAAMLEVPKHGWTVDALAAGAVACGFSPAAHGILARGPIELVRHFSLGCDVALHAELVAREAELSELTVQNRLVLAVQTRLRLLEPHAETWPQALALRALPSNLAESVSDAHELAGLLLSACGADARVPMAPEPVDDHLKRASVGAVYAAAELYLLTDSSPGFSDTWRFVEREVGALHTLAGAASSASLASLLMGAIFPRGAGGDAEPRGKFRAGPPPPP